MRLARAHALGGLRGVPLPQCLRNVFNDLDTMVPQVPLASAIRVFNDLAVVLPQPPQASAVVPRRFRKASNHCIEHPEAFRLGIFVNDFVAEAIVLQPVSD